MSSFGLSHSEEQRARASLCTHYFSQMINSDSGRDPSQKSRNTNVSTVVAVGQSVMQPQHLLRFE